MKNLLLLVFLLLGTVSSALPPFRYCETEKPIEEYLNDHISGGWNFDALAQYKTTDGWSVDTMNTDTTYTVQVVVHIVYFNDDIYQNISDSLIYTQIDALNRDFNKMNDDTIDLRPEFMKFLGNAKIKFQIATVKPNGLPGIGITRKKVNPFPNGWSALTNNVKKENPLDVKHSGVNPWTVKKYLNIWVCDLNWNTRNCDTCGWLGGYAQAPKGLPNWNIGGLDLAAVYSPSTDGVVIDYRFFGQNNFYNRDFLGGRDRYGMGRTTVHEVEHYMGLRHTWGDYGTLNPDIGCTVDDGIEDTPNEKFAYANYFNAGNICDTIVNSCDVPYPGDGIDYPDLFEDFMDYSTDQCYALFTKEQVNLMRYALVNKRPEIIVKREVTQVSTPIKDNKVILFTIYPNPTKSILNIELNRSISEGNIQLINTVGQVVSTQVLYPSQTRYTMDVRSLPKGIYLLNMQTENHLYSERIILE